MRILLVHKDPEVRDMAAFTLESKFAAKTQVAPSLNAAIEYIQGSKEEPFHLVIFQDALEGESCFSELMALIPKLPIMAIAQGKYATKSKRKIVPIDAANLVDNLYLQIRSLIAQGTLKTDQDDGEFCRIRTKLLIKVSPLKGDVYIRLSEFHYVKLFKQGDSFDKSDLEKYGEKKKVEYFYLRKGETAEFVQKYKKLLNDYLMKSEVFGESGLNNSISVHETVQELASKLGFTEEVKDLTKTHVLITMKTMGANPKLKDVLSRIDREKGKYISSHSMILAHIACAVAKSMEWSSDATFYKLTLAAFLHDITIKNEDIARIRSLEELQQKQEFFKKEELEGFRNHPVDGAKIAQSFSEVPPDVDTIIMQHHEKPDGSGFPRKLAGPYINQLSAVFIIAHELVQRSLESEIPLGNILEELKQTYTSGTFKKIVNTIESLPNL